MFPKWWRQIGFFAVRTSSSCHSGTGMPAGNDDRRDTHDGNTASALDRIERVIAYKNVQFIIDHQHDTPEQLSAYLKACMDELGHVPAKVEVIGGDYLEYRFGTWRKALGSFYSGSIASSKNPPPFAARKIVRDLYALELRRKERSAGEVQR